MQQLKSLDSKLLNKLSIKQQDNLKLMSILTKQPQSLRSLKILKLAKLTQSLQKNKNILYNNSPIKNLYRTKISLNSARDSRPAEFGKISIMSDSLRLFPSRYTTRPPSNKKYQNSEEEVRKQKKIRKQLEVKNSLTHENQTKKHTIEEMKYKLDYQSFNYITKVIDRNDLWQKFVRKG